MKQSNTFWRPISSMPVFIILVLVSFACMSLPSCNTKDQNSSPAADEALSPDTCVFLTVVPVVNADSALDFDCAGPRFTSFGPLNGFYTVEYVDNPAPGGINTSEKVVQVIQTPAIENWAGFFFDLSEKIDFSDYAGVKMKVYSPVAGLMVNLKLEDKKEGTIKSEVTLATTVSKEWEELCFGFSERDNGKFDRIVLFFDFMSAKDTKTIHYFDDIIVGDGCMARSAGPIDSPSVAAPTPTRPKAGVISIFSDAYTDVAGTDFNPAWDKATTQAIIEIEGNRILKYESLDFDGIIFGSSVDISLMTHLHVDYWTANSNWFSCFIRSPGPLETPYTFPVTTGEWVSVDIPLTTYEYDVELRDVIEMKFVGNGTIYLDNIYYY